MGDIYSQASQVLIYLGKMDSSVKGVLKCMPAYSWSSSISKDVDPVINLLRRPWFQRTWVFQEAALAKRAQFICGDQSIPWAVFQKYIQDMTFEHTYRTKIPAFKSIDRIVSGIFLMTSARSALRPEWLIFLPHFLYYQAKIRYSSVAALPHQQTSLELLDLIVETRSFSCTKPEDRIFSLLGVTSQDIGSKYLAQNSSLSPGDVFRNFVLRDIFHNNSLRTLGCSSDQSGSQYSSPSWVPDFERLDPQTSLTGMKNRVKFNASAGLPMELWTSNEETVLNVKGRIVDTLHTI
ncbi:hypothetical protein KNSL1_012461 [Colletotrichum chrysophilum]|nr:hypothetical protein KNSL1_012461 [Colletotrichum chrysophilum]